MAEILKITKVGATSLSIQYVDGRGERSLLVSITECPIGEAPLRVRAVGLKPG